MHGDAARAIFLDASVLVSLYTHEPRSLIVRSRVEAETLKYTTPFCYYEALNKFKAKWKFQKQLETQEYLNACSRLTAWYGGALRSGYIQDVDFTQPEVFREVRSLVDRSGLDFSDAFQIFSVKSGYFSHAPGDSRTILATTGRGLADQARLEGVRTWHIELEEFPDN